jgi:hypothetical protein
MWKEAHTIAFGYNAPEGSYDRMLKIMHLCDRVEDRLDKYSRQAETMKRISNVILIHSINELRRRR